MLLQRFIIATVTWLGLIIIARFVYVCLGGEVVILVYVSNSDPDKMESGAFSMLSEKTPKAKPKKIAFF